MYSAIHSYCISVLDGGEWSASYPSKCTPREVPSHTHWIACWAGKNLVPTGIWTPDHPACSLVTILTMLSWLQWTGSVRKILNKDTESINLLGFRPQQSSCTVKKKVHITWWHVSKGIQWKQLKSQIKSNIHNNMITNQTFYYVWIGKTPCVWKQCNVDVFPVWKMLDAMPVLIALAAPV